VFHQDDVKVVDDGLTGKENNRLHALAGGNCNPAKTERTQPRAGDCDDIGDHHRRHAGPHRALDTHAQLNQQIRPRQAHQAFHHEVDGKRAKRVNSLNVAASHPERDIENRPQRQQGNKNRIRQVEISGQRRS